jgi:hypothetical protein
MDLESRNTTLQTELDTATPTSLSRRNQDPATWLPRSPARHTLQSHRQPVTCVAFHPVFSSLASGSEDATIKIWDWELGELERTIKGHTKGVLDIDYGGPRGGTLLASCSSDLTIKLWDPSDEYKNIRTLPGHDHSVSAVRFIPSGAAGAPSSGNLLASASRDKTIRIWDVTTGYCVKTIRGHADWVRDVAPSFDGRWLLSVGNDQTARLWDTQSGDAKVTFVGHELRRVCCYCWSRQADQAVGCQRNFGQNTRWSRQLGASSAFPPRRQIPPQLRRRQNDTMLGPVTRRKMRQDHRRCPWPLRQQYALGAWCDQRCCSCQQRCCYQRIETRRRSGQNQHSLCHRNR